MVCFESSFENRLVLVKTLRPVQGRLHGCGRSEALIPKQDALFRLRKIIVAMFDGQLSLENPHIVRLDKALEG
jgi:hypothetical protein